MTPAEANFLSEFPKDTSTVLFYGKRGNIQKVRFLFNKWMALVEFHHGTGWCSVCELSVIRDLSATQLQDANDSWHFVENSLRQASMSSYYSSMNLQWLEVCLKAESYIVLEEK
jgi:hypothetical protein